MAPGSITARRSSLGAASGGGGSSSHTTVNTGPFTPQQQRALMKLAGGPLAQNATGNPYQYHQQQQQYAMMVQMRALAAAVEQQRSAAAYLQPGFPLQHVVQQQQQRRQIGGPLGFNAYPAVPQVYPPRPAMHPAPLPAAPHHHHLPLYAINNGNGDGSSSFEGGVLVQHQFQPSNSNSQSTFLQNYYSPSLHHQSPPPPPPPTSIQSSSQQYRFVGGEPTNSYRLVTQSQLAHQQHLQTDIGTPTVGPALPTPALKTADNASAGPKASIGDFHCSSTSHEPTKIADMMMSPTTMPAEEEEAGQQQQQQWQQQAGQRSNSSSMSSIDMSHAAIPGAGLLPNASSRSPPSAMQQQHEGGNIRLLSASSPLLPAAAAQQSHGIEVTSSTSDKGQDLAASLNPGIPPTSDSDTAHAVASATPRPTATASSGKTAGDNTITQKGSTQISPTSSTSYSSTVNPSSSPRAEPLNMPKGQHAKNTSQKNANGKKPPRKQKQARRPTLTVDTSILPDQATVPPAAAVVRNPVADVAPAQIPSNSIYQVTAGLQHPSYVVEMQPVQTAPTFT